MDDPVESGELDLLVCPICGNRRFYLSLDDSTVFLSVREGVEPADADPEALVRWKGAATALHCTSCSWAGRAGELVSRTG